MSYGLKYNNDYCKSAFQVFSSPLSEFKGVAWPRCVPVHTTTGDGAWFTIETVEV